MSDEQIDSLNGNQTATDATAQSEAVPTTPANDVELSTEQIAERFAQFVARNDSKPNVKGDNGAQATPSTDDAAKASADTDKPGDEGAERDASGRFASKSSKKADDKTVNPADLDKARQTLKRNQIPDDVIDLMKPERLIESASMLAKREADRNREVQQARLTREQVEAVLAERDKAGSTTTTATSVPAKLAERFKSKITEVLGVLGDDELYADLKDPLGIALTSMGEEVGLEIEQLRAEHKQQMDAMQAEYAGQRNQMLMERERELIASAASDDQLSGLFPELKDPENMKKVVEQVYVIAHGDKDQILFYDDEGKPRWHDLVEAASRKLFGTGRDPQKQAQARLAEKSKKLTDSALTPDTGSDKARPRSLSFVEQMQLAHRELEKGKTTEQVQQLLASAG